MLRRGFSRLFPIAAFVAVFFVLYFLTGSDLGSMFAFIWGVGSFVVSGVMTLLGSLFTAIASFAA